MDPMLPCNHSSPSLERSTRPIDRERGKGQLHWDGHRARRVDVRVIIIKPSVTGVSCGRFNQITETTRVTPRGDRAQVWNRQYLKRFRLDTPRGIYPGDRVESSILHGNACARGTGAPIVREVGIR